jgi:hypothetical protein
MARAQRGKDPEVAGAADEGEKRTSLVDDAYAALRAAIRDASFARRCTRRRSGCRRTGSCASCPGRAS